MISKKHIKICTTLNYIEIFLILASTITEWVSISYFASLVGIPIGTTSSAIGLKICAIATKIKMYDSIIKKKNKKHDKVVLLAKSELNSIGILISNVLIDSDISHDEFVLINIIKEDNKMKDEITNLKSWSRLSKILVYYNNIIVVGSVKKYRKQKSKNCKYQKPKNNAFIKSSVCDKHL